MHTSLSSYLIIAEILWWDTRKLREPIESLNLSLTTAPRSASSARATPNLSNSTEIAATAASGSTRNFGGISIDLDQTSSTRFLVGTDQGLVLWCNRKGKSQNDRIVQSYSGHHGPIYSVQRNPFLSRYFLTVGDWSAKVCYLRFIHRMK